MKYITRRVMDGDDDKEGPEQHQTHHSGPRCVLFLFFFLCFYILTNVL